MSTYTQILYQLVFCTRSRKPVLIKENRDELFMYISGLLRNKKCHLYIINGVEDHIHIVTHLHPSVALSDLMKDIKLSTTQLIKEKNLFPGFAGWMDGFGAFTYSWRHKENVIKYVANQEAHHSKESLQEEYYRLLKEHEISYDERFVP